jgi:hypothetical protein
MASREAGARGGSRLADRESSSKGVAPKKVLEMMKEATGASDEDICVMLQLCGGDANEATEKLLESECRRATLAGRSRAREAVSCHSAVRKSILWGQSLSCGLVGR